MFTSLAFYALTAITLLLALYFAIPGFWRLRRQSDYIVRRRIDAGAVLVLAALLLFVLSGARYPLHFAMPPMMQAMVPAGAPPSLPVVSLIQFLLDRDRFERVADIGRDPNDVPPPIGDRAPELVKISMTSKEVLSEIAPGVWNNYWTYDGTVPGPMLRVRVGDTVELSLRNHETSIHHHNIDLHSVTGPGGGAAVTDVAPGETKTFRWLAKHPGLYIYHCAMPNVSTHNAHGQYGLILVEPEGGLAPVDKEFYVVQGELYTAGGIGKKGLLAFDSQALLDNIPTYITFNGRIESAPRMHAKVGDRVRMYVGNGGVGLISSFHVIGEIFDVVNPEGSITPGSAVFKDVQTTIVPAGGAAVVEFTLDVPGKYVLVDHALARMNKGAWAVLEVTGEPNPAVFESLGGDAAVAADEMGGM
jgi:nitrite reductase (NO-forming)